MLKFIRLVLCCLFFSFGLFAYHDQFGLCGNPELDNSEGRALFNQLNVEWIRAGWEWGQIEDKEGLIFEGPEGPTPGEKIKIEIMDNLVKYAQNHNINILSGLAYNPDFYGLIGTTRCLDPIHIDKWTRYVTFMVERYDGDGYLDMPGLTKPIKHWEIWNEPNLVQFWNTGSVLIYPAKVSFVDWILIPGIAAIKAADPTAKICGPGLSSSPTGDPYAWFDYMKERGVVFDVLTHHQYDGGDTANGRYNELLEFHNYADARGYSGKEFWITETGWPPNNFKGNAVQNMRGMLDLMLAHNGWWNKTFWFAWKSNETIPNEMYFMVDKTTNIPNDLYYTFKSYTNLPSITVTSPNGGERWMVGSSHDITWISTGTIASINIKINTGQEEPDSFNWLPLATNIANNGSYAWTVPANPSTTCLVRVSDAGNDVIFDRSDAIFTISADASIAVTTPNGGENWTADSSHDITWSSTGTIANVNIDYSSNNGGSWSPVATGTANDGSYAWAIPSTPSTTCLVQVRDTDGNPSDTSNAVFTIAASSAETVSAPNTPTGPSTGLIATSYNFSTGGSTSSLGHTVQYKFDWDDGSDSGWLAMGTTTAPHSWSAAGTYDVRAMARCTTHTSVESAWSATYTVIIYDGSVTGHYNSPTQYKVLPEVIWAPATGGGTWMSEVQITDLSGGSQVSVYYSTTAGRRGPFLLWNNGSGGALRSQKYTNMLQTIDGLDSEAFTYYGTVGAVELITQDANHVLQVMARTLNGNYSKTFLAFSLHDSNTANTSRVLIIPNLTNNSVYRSTCGMYNPTAAALTVQLKLLDSVNTQIGSTITKTLDGYGFSAFSPFSEAGRPYSTYSYDNVILRVQPTSGTGKVFCFGASANNATNDPAAHLAVQNGSGHDNGPSHLQILPEVIWAPATGGGTWMSEVQIVDVTGGSTVSVYFDYGGGNRRGPFALWTGSGAGAKVKYANILQQIGTIDSGLTYYGKGGTVEFMTQDGSHTVQVTARILNGNYSKTFPGLNLVDAETADTSRVMLIQNYTNNVTYRSTCGFYNPTADSITVEYTLLNGSGAQIGSSFSKTLVGHDFVSFSPFTEAGVPYPANSYDNVILTVRPTSGSGKVVCFGASANSASSDPAAHLAMQAE